MMSARPLVLLSLSFAAGFLIAWLAKPGQDGRPAEVAPTVSETRRTQRETATRRATAAESRTDAHLDKLLEGEHPGWLSNAAEGITPDDYPLLLAALQRKAGLTGLDSKGRGLLDHLVTSWYDNHPDDALQWVLGIGNPNDESELLGEIIGHLADKDPAAAIALAEQHGAAAGREIDMPYEMREAMAKLDPDEFARVTSMFLSSNGFSGSSISFPSNFRFEETLDRLAEASKQLPEGKGFQCVPSNLLSEWAKRDFNAAWAWAHSGKEVSFNRVDGLLDEYARTADSKDVANLAVSLLAQPETEDYDSKPIRQVWQLLSERPTPEVLGLYFEQAPGNRQDNLNRLFEMAQSGSGGSYDTFKEVLLRQMTPGERAAVFEHQKASGSSCVDRDDYEPILHRLGHSPEEIDRMLPKKDPP